MVNRNMINVMVSSTKTNITLNKQLLNEKTNFSYFPNGTTSNLPILPSSIQQSVYGNTLQTEVTIDKYDIKGNALQTTEKNGIVTSYFWGYNNQYPVAKVIGTTYDFVLQNSGLNLTLINTTGTSDIDMRVELNKIRTSLPNNFITTYTYKPLIGITSETDQTNYTKYYEYDNFNRLTLVRDQDNNILKKICYNYAGQPEDCPLITNTTPMWQPTGNTRCQPCAANNAYNSGVREKEEKDINPNSATPNAIRWVVDPSGTCPTPPNFQTTNGLICEVINGVNTGNAIQSTADVNPCSITFNQPGPNIVTPNHAPCTPCIPACASPQYICIGGTCVQGFLKVVKVSRLTKTTWECTKAYCFPTTTGSILTNGYTVGPGAYTEVTTSTTPCDIECF